MINISFIVLLFFSCQFVVSANGNYTVCLNDPDVLVDWNLVEQIVSCKYVIINNLLVSVYFR